MASAQSQRARSAARENVGELPAEMRPELAWIGQIRAAVNAAKQARDHDRPGISFRLRAAAT